MSESSRSALGEHSLSALGEKGFIASLLPGLYHDPRLVSGFGHDASVVTLEGAPFDLIQKIDRASYPVSLKHGWSGHDAWGRMAVTANCSDILASGGTPLSVMIAVLLPGDELAANAAAIVAGAADECRRHGVVFAGGDTKEARDPHVVGTAAGVIERGAFLPRNTAEPGDALFCAGRIGGFGGAFFLLQRFGVAPQWVRYLAHPVAQWDAARLINSARLARCGMDASDGLLDVLQSLASGGAGVRLDLAAMPYHDFALDCAARTAIPLTQLLFAGGDWNIVYSVPEAAAGELAARAAAAGAPLFRIGEVIADPGAVRAVDPAGREFELRGMVNEHFKDRIEDAAGFMDHIAEGNFLHATGS